MWNRSRGYSTFVVRYNHSTNHKLEITGIDGLLLTSDDAAYYGYEFFNHWNDVKFLGLQSMNFYVLSISALIFYSKTKKAGAPNTLKFSKLLVYFIRSIMLFQAILQLVFKDFHNY